MALSCGLNRPPSLPPRPWRFLGRWTELQMVPSRERGERGRGEKGAWHSRGGRWRHTSRRGSIVTSTGDGTPAPSYHLGVDKQVKCTKNTTVNW